MMAGTQVSPRRAIDDGPSGPIVEPIGGTAFGSFHQWSATLRAYRVVVEQQRSFLEALDAAGEIVETVTLPPAFVPPARLGPMPPACLDEALALQRDTQELIAAATAMLARRRPANATRSMAGFVPVRSASSMDQRI